LLLLLLTTWPTSEYHHRHYKITFFVQSDCLLKMVLIRSEM